MIKRSVVWVLATVDRGVDAVLYRSAVVKAFEWMPRWWRCDLARLSIALDGRWRVGWWDAAGIVPGGLCEACGRRAAIHVLGGLELDEPATGTFWDTRIVRLCGWCNVQESIYDETDLQQALRRARARSIAWRWSAR